MMSVTTPDRPAGSALTRGRGLLLAALAVSVVAANAASKQWAVRALAEQDVDVLGPFRLSLGFNTGVAFSAGTGVPAAVLASVSAQSA